jgi:hypothetical protein
MAPAVKNKKGRNRAGYLFKDAKWPNKKIPYVISNQFNIFERNL